MEGFRNQKGMKFEFQMLERIESYHAHTDKLDYLKDPSQEFKQSFCLVFL